MTAAPIQLRQITQHHPFRTSGGRVGYLDIAWLPAMIVVTLQCSGGDVRPGQDASDLHSIFAPLLAPLRRDIRRRPVRFTTPALWRTGIVRDAMQESAC